MNLDLHGRLALVTGRPAGIGRAIADGLAAAGAAGVVNGRSQARVDQAVAAVRGAVPGATVHGVAADLGTAEGAARVVAAHPSVAILVNNRGIFEPVPGEEIADEAWTAFFETNVMSGVRLSRAYLAGMRERNWGRVVFVSSESGLHIPAEMIHYGVTKTAQIALARGLAETLAGTGVTVNSVLPGPTSSEGVATFVRQMAEQQQVDEAEMERRFFQTARPTSLLRRFITPEEVANLVVYVCSPAASATTGAALRVDGG